MASHIAVLEMYNKGYPLSYIGRVFGVSRQRIWQIVKNNLTKVDTKKRDEPRAQKQNPRDEEVVIIRKLNKQGIDAYPANYNSPYDIFLKSGKTIEVKRRTKTIKKGGSYYWSFNYLFGKEKPDYCVLICIDGKKINYFIVPGEQITSSHINISTDPKNKNTRRFYKKYLDKWSNIK